MLNAASANDFIIIEDDYEAEMNYVTQTSPSLRSLDDSGRVIYIGSLSKTVSPGIRLGFIVAHSDIIQQARIARGVMMRHPPTIVQEIVARFFQLGHYDAHLRNIERRYHKTLACYELCNIKKSKYAIPNSHSWWYVILAYWN